MTAEAAALVASQQDGFVATRLAVTVQILRAIGITLNNENPAPQRRPEKSRESRIISEAWRAAGSFAAFGVTE